MEDFKPREKINIPFEEIERFWKMENFEMNGRKLEFYGVAHIPETLERPEYRRELESAIERASLVVLEAAPVAEGAYSNEAIEILQKWAQMQGYDVSREEIVKKLEDNKGLAFYRSLENIAAERKKRVAVVDPLRMDLGKAETLEERDKDVALAKILAAVGGTLGFIASAYPDIQREAQKKQTENKDKAKKSGEISRRTFLCRLLGLGSALSYGSLAATVIDLIGENRGRKKNPLGPLLYDKLDFRDVAVAKGLDLITKRQDLKEGPVVIIYGALHRSAIRHYIESPKEREIKYSAYVPYRSAAPAQLRLYEFQEKKGWKEIETKDI